MTSKPEIYLSTVLLEKNRWGSKEPSLRVSDWLSEIQGGGFDGLELWENHLLKADQKELDAIKGSSLPVKILNTYCEFDRESGSQREASATLARELKVSGVKFNFGNKVHLIDEYRENLLDWADQLPRGCRLLCECHPYTVLEEKEKAAEILEPLKGKIEIILHAFSGVGEDWEQRIGLFGTSITHIHVAGGGEEGFRYSPLATCQKIEKGLAMLKDAGCETTWTIEFCDGVASKEEEIHDVLRNAIADARVLRDQLTCSN